MVSKYIKPPTFTPYKSSTTNAGRPIPKPPYFYKPPTFTKSNPAVPSALKNRTDANGNLRVTADTADILTKGKAAKLQPPRFVKPPKFTKKKVTKKEETVIIPPEDSGGYDEVPWDPPSYPSPPDTPTPTPPPNFIPPIKTAPIDTVLFDDESVSAEIIADLLFEDIGGQEILKIARHDTVNGQSVSYQPIKNLSAIQQEYDPEKLLKLRSTAKDIFANFPINLASKIPNVGNGLNGSNYYLDADGNLVLEFINLEPDEQIEIQITSSGTIEEVGD